MGRDDGVSDNVEGFNDGKSVDNCVGDIVGVLIGEIDGWKEGIEVIGASVGRADGEAV